MDFTNTSLPSTTPAPAKRAANGLRFRLVRLSRLAHQAVALIGLAAVLGHPAPAHAADGCLVLLCFAAPSWRAIAQCVPPIRSVLDDLAHGRPFPSCSMSGAGNSAANAWANAPAFCPPQYTLTLETESTPVYQCVYLGAVAVTVNGALWTRTWWTLGDTVTEYSDAAKAALGTWDTRFDDDLAAWLATRPPAPPSCTEC
jgi:hypothetical protein